MSSLDRLGGGSSGGGLTDTELRASPVPVSLTSTTISGSVAVTGTFWQATQPVSGTFWQATQPVSIAAAVASAQSGAWTTGRTWTLSSGTDSVAVTGTFWQATQPVSGTVTANSATSNGKTITYVSVAQGAAGTTVLAAASASNKHKVIGCILIMDAAGTLKFTDGVADLTGAMSMAANSGFVLNTSEFPFTETGAINRALNLVTTTGKAAGVVAILTEP